MNLPFRLGATSYVIPADILPNLHYLAGKVQDVELVLFEVDDGPNNLPAPAQLDEMNAIAREHGLTFTVHLPLDLRLADNGSLRHISLEKARRVIECVHSLDPVAWVLHLDGKAVRGNPSPEAYDRWLEQAEASLRQVGMWAGGLERLAVENLEGYPLDFYEPVFARLPVSRCVDIGHLWLDGHAPLSYLRRALPRTRVIHIHGLAERDHRSLAFVPPESLRVVLQELIHAQYRGVLTVEVFSEEDFVSSLEAIWRVLQDA
ncbi:MAG: sugar phosphate isomerase/epimerase [Anaerolineales bacterium]|nr:sugar phosphate isomerase/epimerase [Anaerolineales bacterium]MCX7755385.1 sugar phosphate isomerase/epimerase [Anaerolineales bacterium]MDW8278573.1 cobamide remodeling phosphodiesterase CbiR [Anaerolineales bacterium]